MDSNSKKIIEKLVKIAEKQQAIINKLAQSAFNPTGTEPPPAESKPNMPAHMQPADALKAKIKANPALAAGVVDVQPDPRKQELTVIFQRGKSRALWNAALAAKKQAEQDQTLLPGWGIAGTEA